MDLSDKKMLRRVLNRLSLNLNFVLDEKIKDKFFKGENQNFLQYDKLERNELDVPIIEKYILGVESYLKQPSPNYYYDIFNAGRLIPQVVSLDNAINVLIKKDVYGRQERIKRLLKEKTYDGFEAVMFELIVAAKYASKTKKGNVKFIEETHITSPDIEAVIRRRKYFIECKKPDRENDASLSIKNRISEKVKKTLDVFIGKKNSAIIELSIHVDPTVLDEANILSAALASYETGKLIVDIQFSLLVQKINLRQSAYLDLYPAPGYFATHFGYFPEGEWQGIIPIIDCEWETPGWIDRINCEVAVKWKITDEELIWRMKKIGHKFIFKGFEQLNSMGENIILHYWFERDRNIGNREKELKHLVKTLIEKRILFNWLILNETSPSLSPLGRFDFVENAHYSRGLNAMSSLKELKRTFPVGHVFLFDEDSIDEGPFGIGAILPPIDFDDESWKVNKKARRR